ncbi:MAG: hypothetical protein LKI88_01490 [Bifidobacterium sp.]|jgi:hypothetical protein|nr:hypothetical protein [Bifidobacterium sp.]MCI1864598.1 hypothetical protein [Bifidobacterium sp.]
MFSKHIARKIMGVIGALAAMLCLSSPAFANNHADSGWSAYLAGWQTVDTPNRQKQDASSGYIAAHNISGGRQIRAWMLGYHNEDVHSQTVYLRAGQWSYVTNNTYEWFGRKQVHMRIQNIQLSNGATSASGVWSPDSV